MPRATRRIAGHSFAYNYDTELWFIEHEDLGYVTIEDRSRPGASIPTWVAESSPAKNSLYGRMYVVGDSPEAAWVELLKGRQNEANQLLVTIQRLLNRAAKAADKTKTRAQRVGLVQNLNFEE